MGPEGTDEVRLKDASVTSSLIAIEVGVFAALVWLSGTPRSVLGVPPEILRWLGGNHGLWTIADSRFETLVTSIFLHGSLVHLAFNMLVLAQVGPFLEKAASPARFLPLFLGSGVAGSACSAIWGRAFGPALSVGASGAVCGLLGATLVLAIRTEGWKGSLAWKIGAWLAFLLVFGLAKNLQGGLVQVDNAAHVGGAFAGIMIAVSWSRDAVWTPRASQNVVAMCLGVVMLAGLVVFVRDRTDPYLFLDHEERMNAAVEALRDGRCDRARAAMERARQMDPRNRGMRALSQDIDRACETGEEPRARRGT